MALPQKYWPLLEQAYANLKEAFALQLAKDLQVPVQNLPQENWQPWLSQHLENHIKDLPVFIYRVDISEQQIKSSAPRNTDHLAQLILERVAQKVIFKAQYAGKL
jgi:hypothetical protein